MEHANGQQAKQQKDIEASTAITVANFSPVRAEQLQHVLAVC